MAVLTVETPNALKDFVGKEIGASEWLVVKQERIHEFAKATEDRQWIHLDRERAKRFPSPVCEGARIRGRFTLLSFRDLGEAREALFSCSVECQGNSKPCCVAEWIVRYYK